MKRRDILKASGLALGYSLMGGTALAVMNGCKADTKQDWTPKQLSADMMPTLRSMVDRIIPKTATPGALEAKVDRYIDEAVHSTFTSEEKDSFMKGLMQVNELATSKYGARFDKLSDSDKDALLQNLADQAKDSDDYSIFNTVKELTVSGFFTSETGATQALLHLPVPGPYQGCIPYSEVGQPYSS